MQTKIIFLKNLDPSLIPQPHNLFIDYYWIVRSFKLTSYVCTFDFKGVID